MGRFYVCFVKAKGMHVSNLGKEFNITIEGIQNINISLVIFVEIKNEIFKKWTEIYRYLIQLFSMFGFHA